MSRQSMQKSWSRIFYCSFKSRLEVGSYFMIIRSFNDYRMRSCSAVSRMGSMIGFAYFLGGAHRFFSFKANTLSS